MVFGWRFKRQYTVSVVMLCELEAVVSPPKLIYVSDIGSKVLSKKSCQVDAITFLECCTGIEDSSCLQCQSKTFIMDSIVLNVAPPKIYVYANMFLTTLSNPLRQCS